MPFHIAPALKSSAVTAGAVLWIGTAAAAPLPMFPTNSAPSSLTRDQALADENGLAGLPRDLRRQTVNYPTKAAAGSVVIDMAQTFLYYVLGDGTAIRYGIGVGREGFTWSGSQAVTRKAEWPDWTPPQAMIARQPYLPRWMAGGEGNPSVLAPSTSAAPSTEFTAPTCRKQSARKFRAVVSGCSMRM